MAEIKVYRLFLASSSELERDRERFEIAVNRKNKLLVPQGVFLHLSVWEHFLDTVSATRLQDEYNQEIRRCELFVMLYWTKVGRYTREEFETALGQFHATGKPRLWTYFKTEASEHPPSDADIASLNAFQTRLDELQHFRTEYSTHEHLTGHFSGQLDQLVDNGFIEFNPTANPPLPSSPSGGNTATATNGGIAIGGHNYGSASTHTTTHLPAGAVAPSPPRPRPSSNWAPLFARLRASVVQAGLDKLDVALAIADINAMEQMLIDEDVVDETMAKHISNLVRIAPATRGELQRVFSAPALDGASRGQVTRLVLGLL